HRAPTSPPFPYTTLFRSRRSRQRVPPDNAVHPNAQEPLQHPRRTRNTRIDGEVIEAHRDQRGHFPGTRPVPEVTLEDVAGRILGDRKSTRLNSSHVSISY